MSDEEVFDFDAWRRDQGRRGPRFKALGQTYEAPSEQPFDIALGVQRDVDPDRQMSVAELDVLIERTLGTDNVVDMRRRGMGLQGFFELMVFVNAKHNGASDVAAAEAMVESYEKASAAATKVEEGKPPAARRGTRPTRSSATSGSSKPTSSASTRSTSPKRKAR